VKVGEGVEMRDTGCAEAPNLRGGLEEGLSTSPLLGSGSII